MNKFDILRIWLYTLSVVFLCSIFDHQVIHESIVMAYGVEDFGKP